LEISEEQATIATHLEKKKQQGYPLGGTTSFIWWSRFEASGRQALPFPGALADQPDWWWDDVLVFDQMSTLFELEHEKNRLHKRMNKR
jgi:hypothetical protein